MFYKQFKYFYFVVFVSRQIIRILFLAWFVCLFDFYAFMPTQVEDNVSTIIIAFICPLKLFWRWEFLMGKLTFICHATFSSFSLLVTSSLHKECVPDYQILVLPLDFLTCQLIISPLHKEFSKSKAISIIWYLHVFTC